jgi:hypothetical protein
MKRTFSDRLDTVSDDEFGGLASEWSASQLMLDWRLITESTQGRLETGIERARSIPS